MFNFFKKKKVQNIDKNKSLFKVECIRERVKLFKYDITIKMIDGDIFTTSLEDKLDLYENEGCLVTGKINYYFSNPIKPVKLKTYSIQNMEDFISIGYNWKINKVNWSGSVSYEAIVHVLNSNQISSIKYEKSVLETTSVLTEKLTLI